MPHEELGFKDKGTALGRLFHPADPQGAHRCPTSVSMPAGDTGGLCWAWCSSWVSAACCPRQSSDASHRPGSRGLTHAASGLRVPCLPVLLRGTLSAEQTRLVQKLPCFWPDWFLQQCFKVLPVCRILRPLCLFCLRPPCTRRGSTACSPALGACIYTCRRLTPPAETSVNTAQLVT